MYDEAIGGSIGGHILLAIKFYVYVSNITGKILPMGLEGEDIRRRGGKGAGGKARESLALSMFIMIRDTAMLWHHISLGTVAAAAALTAAAFTPKCVSDHCRSRVRAKMHFRPPQALRPP